MMEINKDLLDHPLYVTANCKLPPLPEGYIQAKSIPELLKTYAGNEEITKLIHTYKWYFDVLSIVVKYYEKVGPIMHDYRTMLKELIETNTKLVGELDRLKTELGKEVAA